MMKYGNYVSGVIIQYRLYHNGLLVYTSANNRQYSIDNLQPWSLHTFRVEACTSRGCGSSEEVQVQMGYSEYEFLSNLFHKRLSEA